jgi:hypothetical protein
VFSFTCSISPFIFSPKHKKRNTAASNTYLPAVIVVAMIVGKYEGNEEGERFHT